MKSTVLIFALALRSAAATADQYTISTFAGGAPPPTTAGAMDIPIGLPSPSRFQGVA